MGQRKCHHKGSEVEKDFVYLKNRREAKGWLEPSEARAGLEEYTVNLYHLRFEHFI